MSEKTESKEELRDEYDFAGGARGLYAKRFRAGSNVVVLDPDVAAAFPNAAEVNRVLRAYLAAQKNELGS